MTRAALALGGAVLLWVASLILLATSEGRPHLDKDRDHGVYLENH